MRRGTREWLDREDRAAWEKAQLRASEYRMRQDARAAMEEWVKGPEGRRYLRNEASRRRDRRARRKREGGASC